MTGIALTAARWALIMRLSGDEDQLTWISRSVRTPIIARVQLIHHKAATSQEVFRFEAKQVSHLERVHVALASAIGRDVVDQFDVVHLRESILVGNLEGAHHLPTIGHGKGRALRHLDVDRPVHEIVERRIEQVEDESSAVLQVSMNAREARNLGVHRQQVLEGTEGKGDECEFPAQVERGHVALVQVHPRLHVRRFGAQLGPAQLQHCR
jgi:hypothetical protein